LFLIDSGANHNVLSESYALSKGLMPYAIEATRNISGFDGSSSTSCYKIDLSLEAEPGTSCFIITKLKDSYNGILGMPWITIHGAKIDWTNRQLRPLPTRIATTNVLSSSPPKTLSGPMGHARMIDEGVCAIRTLAPPQCELEPHSLTRNPEKAGKQDPFMVFLSQDKTPDSQGPMVKPIATAEAVLSIPKNTST
jgi:hypothetical protein